MTENAENIEACLPALRRFAISLCRDGVHADELVQECVTRALERIDQYEGGTNLQAWLFTMLRNLHIDHVRKQQRRPESAELDGVPASNLAISAAQFSHVELQECLISFQELPEADRQVLLMIAVEGHSYAETARRMNVAVGTIKSRLSRARERLRVQRDDPDIMLLKAA